VVSRVRQRGAARLPSCSGCPLRSCRVDDAGGSSGAFGLSDMQQLGHDAKAKAMLNMLKLAGRVALVPGRSGQYRVVP